MSALTPLERAKAFEAQTVKLYQRIETRERAFGVVVKHDYVPALPADVRLWLLDLSDEERREAGIEELTRCERHKEYALAGDKRCRYEADSTFHCRMVSVLVWPAP